MPFFNPASNAAQRSQLRIVNWGYSTATINIVSVDDDAASRGRGVTFEVAAGKSATFTSAELENGSSRFDGSLGHGVGKWRLFVFGDDMAYVHVTSLLESPTGHLTNLTPTGTHLAPPLPPAIPDRKLRAIVAEALGKTPDATVSHPRTSRFDRPFRPPPPAASRIGRDCR